MCRQDPKFKDSHQCAKHFPKFYSQRTILDTGGYPDYKRLSPEEGGETWTRSDGIVFTDAQVVSHNKFLLQRFRSHINVEFVGPQNVLDYVLKYVLKGHDVAYGESTPFLSTLSSTPPFQ
jgi:hypothetical protein